MIHKGPEGNDKDRKNNMGVTCTMYERGLGGYCDSTDKKICRIYTADFIKKVLSVYTHSMATIYLSLSAQVAKSTFFMKPPIYEVVIIRVYKRAKRNRFHESSCMFICVFNCLITIMNNVEGTEVSKKVYYNTYTKSNLLL